MKTARLKNGPKHRSRRLKRSTTQTLRQLTAFRASTIFTEPSEELKTRCALVPPEGLRGPSIAAIQQQIIDASRVALADTKLTESGQNKIVTVVRLNLELDTTKPATWRAIYDYLIELNVLGVEDGVVPVAQPQAVEQPQPESIDGLSTESREGRAECLRIVGGHWGAEVRNFYALWAESMRVNWGVDVMTEEMARRVGDYFVKFNLNPLRHQSYDNFRLAANRNGWLPGDRDYRTEREKLDALMETANLNDRDVRRDIALRSQELTRK